MDVPGAHPACRWTRGGWPLDRKSCLCAAMVCASVGDRRRCNSAGYCRDRGYARRGEEGRVKGDLCSECYGRPGSGGQLDVCNRHACQDLNRPSSYPRREPLLAWFVLLTES